MPSQRGRRTPSRVAGALEKGTNPTSSRMRRSSLRRADSSLLSLSWAWASMSSLIRPTAVANAYLPAEDFPT